MNASPLLLVCRHLSDSNCTGLPKKHLESLSFLIYLNMVESDAYYTLKGEGSFELKEKGSRFIAYACPVCKRDDAEAFIQRLSKKHHDAAHLCSAYLIGLGDAAVYRYNDAGEPSGTAGKPILDAIRKKHLTDAVCVVSRYFGGVKLGTGGLARAYAHCAAGALDQAGNVRRFVSDPVKISFGYEVTGAVMGVMSRSPAIIEETTYGAETRIRVRIPRSQVEVFKRRLRDATGGRIKIQSEEVNHR